MGEREQSIGGFDELRDLLVRELEAAQASGDADRIRKAQESLAAHDKALKR